MTGRKLFGFDRNVTSAGFVSFFMDLSSEMIYPLVPLFLANTLGVSKSMIGVIAAGRFLLMAFTAADPTIVILGAGVAGALLF